MRKVVVIGGTRGIGAGVSRSLGSADWQVYATGVSAEEVEAFRTQGVATDCSILDVTDDTAVKRYFAGFGDLDGLVNCAGILARDAEYDLDTFKRVIDINLTGTMRTCLAAHPLLAASGRGAIVNTASMLSYFGGPLVPAYSASKGGVAQLTKALAGKWAADGIRVNAVAPGWIATEMTGPLRDDPARSSAILGRTPLDRWGQAEEVGALVCWLLSDDASFVTGSVYPVDGGYSAM